MLPYFPPPDPQGGWRTALTPEAARRSAGLDPARLDSAFEVARQSTRNGGLLVVRHGWLAYERYFGKAQREAAPNLASCGKAVTSLAVGILMAERPELFPDGLDQRIFNPTYLPPEAFPLTDPGKSEIKLGQLLAFTGGIRGNNPCHVNGAETTIDPAGPDGWQAMVDAIALGHEDGTLENGKPFSTRTLWCAPGGGYSYATAAIHAASIMLRHVTGMELQAFVAERLAAPLGWSRWGYGYRGGRLAHTPGGGGIALRGTDMLRFGYLLLRDGNWAGRQVVPADYVRHCRSASPYNPHFSYSLQFNVNSTGRFPNLPRDTFWKLGSGGHAILVVPSLDLVVWLLGGRDAQFAEGNTGLSPVPPSEPPRADWHATVSDDEAYHRVLALVLDAMND